MSAADGRGISVVSHWPRSDMCGANFSWRQEARGATMVDAGGADSDLEFWRARDVRRCTRQDVARRRPDSEC